MVPAMNTRWLHGCLLTLWLGGLVAAGAEVRPPVPQDLRMPAYPVELEDTGRSGNARITLTVTAQGRVTDPQVEWASHPGFGREALTAVRGWRFEPGTRDGEPVPMRVTLPVEFKAPLDQQFNAFLGRRVYRPLPDDAVVLDETAYGRRLRPVRRLPPVLPQALWSNTYREVIEVFCVVSPEGVVHNPVLLSPPENPELATPALLTAALTRFRPPTVRGREPVHVETIIRVDFSQRPIKPAEPYWEQFDGEAVPFSQVGSGQIRPELLNYSLMGPDFMQPR
jgi:TonB family protein